MSPELAGQVAVVTGGNRGIGRAIALAMARAGARLAITGRNAEMLTRTATEVEALGSECLTAVCDVSDAEQVRDATGLVLRRYGQVDVVVANAGIAGPVKPMQEITFDEWRRCLGTDLDGVFLTFKNFIPAMIQRRRGSLIAISSVTGKRPIADRTPYAAAKMGIIGLVRSLAVELGPYGIRVNTVCPGAVDGERFHETIAKQAAAHGLSAADATSQFVAGSPLKRLLGAHEIAAACLFLASEAGSAVTGEDLNVSAGLVMY
jgi:NAD(P)-dependent dehydrogenase (short-subunit alcohol dehydrogenase family)